MYLMPRLRVSSSGDDFLLHQHRQGLAVLAGEPRFRAPRGLVGVCVHDGGIAVDAHEGVWLQPVGQFLALAGADIRVAFMVGEGNLGTGFPEQSHDLLADGHGDIALTHLLPTVAPHGARIVSAMSGIHDDVLAGQGPGGDWPGPGGGRPVSREIAAGGPAGRRRRALRHFRRPSRRRIAECAVRWRRARTGVSPGEACCPRRTWAMGPAEILRPEAAGISALVKSRKTRAGVPTAPACARGSQRPGYALPRSASVSQRRGPPK